MDQKRHKQRTKRNTRKGRMKPIHQSYACGIMDRNSNAKTTQHDLVLDQAMDHLNRSYKAMGELLKENEELKKANDSSEYWRDVWRASSGEYAEGEKKAKEECEALRKQLDHYKKLYQGWKRGAERFCEDLDRMEMDIRKKDTLIDELTKDRDLFATELEKALIEKDEAVQAQKEEAIQEQVKEVKKDNGTQEFGQIV